MSVLGKSLPALLALGALLGALTWLPPLSDGDLAVFDGISYGYHIGQVEQLSADTTGIVTLPNHLGHHVLAYALVGPLRAAGCELPGFVAGRLLAGLGAAALVLLIAGLAGPGRGAVGALFALAVLACRAVLLDAGSGETVLPGAAAALGVLVLACRRPASLARVGLALTLALLLRQDNLLLLPAVVWAVAAGREPGRRLSGVVALLGVAGLVTSGAYAVAWQFSPGERGFFEYLLGIGEAGSWSFLDEVDVSAPWLHLGSFAWALVGRLGPIDEPQLLVSAFYVLGLLGAGALLGGGPLGVGGPLGGGGLPGGGHRRGRRRDPFLVAALLVLAARVPFFLWFEPEHWEWQVLPLVLVAACAARLASGGTPAPRGLRRAAGLALACAVPVGLLAIHAADTWALRRSTLRQAVGQALAQAGPDAEVYAIGLRAAMLLYVQDVPHIQLDVDHHPTLPVAPNLGLAVDAFVRRAHDRAGPTLLVVDRFVRDGMPATRAVSKPYDVIAERGRVAGLAVLRFEGRDYGLLSR